MINNISGILKFIHTLRETDHYIEHIYMNGACYQFHLLLKQYIDCEPMINAEKNHIVTKFKGKLFDITGEVKGEYYKMTKQDIEMVSKWSFHQTKMIQMCECVVCEEPILV